MIESQKNEKDHREEPESLKGRIRELEQAEACWKRGKEAERLAEEMAIIAEIGRVVGSTLDINQVFERVATGVRKLIPYDRLMVTLKKTDDNEFVVVYTSGIDNPRRRVGDSYQSKGTATGVVLSTRAGVLIQPADAEEIKDLYPNLYTTFKAGLRSVMSVPLISMDEVIGSLSFRSKKLKAYSSQDLHLAEKIGVQIAGAIVNAQLFNDLNKMEKSLRENNELFSLFMLHSPFYTYIKEVTPSQSIILQASDNYRQMIGIPGSEMVGKTMTELFPAEFAAKIIKDDRAVISSGTVLRLDEELNGRSYTTIKFPIVMGDKTLLAGYTIDITDRKRAEEALRENEETMRYIIKHDPNAIAVYDLDLHYIAVSDRYLQDYDITEADIIGKHHYDVFPEMPQKWKDVHRRCLSGVIERNDDDHFIRPDGSITYNRWECRPWYRANGEIGGMITYTEVTTERKRAEAERRNMEERLQRAEKMEALGQLAGGVAHDLNNVLGVSAIYSELLQEQIPEESPLRKYVDNILASTQKGAAIIEDLLTLARRGVTAAEVINLSGVISNFFQTPVFEKIQSFHPQVTFRVECPKDLLNIKGSPVHLEKTLMNLVSNASEAIGGAGEVTIHLKNRYLDTPVKGYDQVKQGDYVVLTVSDTGMGIPAENIGKIFEPFYTKKTMGRSGTGLGLAIVWGTVKDHNGYIDVQTEVGEGTTFTLYFPVTREETISQKQKVPIEQYRGCGESVLVVDDVAEQREVASSLLIRLGYKVQVVSKGEEAVEYLKGNTADILVLDMIMPPGIDGLETYRRILEVNPGQKAILVSGYSATDRVKEAQRLGAGAYVKKPYLMEKIGVAIRDELGKQ